MGKLKVFRYYSEMNPRIDFAILTFEDFADKARTAITEAMNRFWSDEEPHLCYGDYVGAMLIIAGVPFYDIFFNEDAEDDPNLWEAIMKKLDPEIIH